MRERGVVSDSLRRAPGVLAGLSCALAALVARADVVYVPRDYPTIQIAIDLVVDGDEIVVEPGWYHELIDLGGKAIRIRSSQGPIKTVIDATGIEGSVVTCKGGETSETILEGFTIRGGTGTIIGSDLRQGGGMYIANSSPTVINCRFIFNRVTQFGGGVYCEGSSTSFRDCSFSGNAALAGGGVYVRQSPVSITSSSFDENAAEWGGGIANSESDIIVEDCQFSGNTAGSRSNGGGISNSASRPVITNCVFDGNSAGTGGGMSNFDAAATVTDCVFVSNCASDGGGLSIAYGDESQIRGCEFAGNTASGASGGGGLFVVSSIVRLSECTFEGNTAITGNGGGAFADAALLEIEQSSLSNNHSPTGLGGGLFSTGRGRAIVVSCTFAGNEADLGGGVYDSGEQASIAQCLFYDNTARRYGGAVFADSVRMEIANSTLARNTARDGGGVFAAAGRTVVSNTVLWYNRAERHREIRVGLDIVNFYFCNVRGGVPVFLQTVGGVTTGQLGNISADPMFLDRDGFDFRLQCASPCIDAGLNEMTDPEILFDLDGRPRLIDDPFITDSGHGQGAVVDIGAFEWQASYSPSIMVQPIPLRGGLPAKIRASYLRWRIPAYLMYSVDGPGSTYVPSLNVTLDIKKPIQVGPVRPASDEGSVVWEFDIPLQALERAVWFQVIQRQLKTNTVEAKITD